MSAVRDRRAALDRWAVLLAAVFVVGGIGLPLVGVGVFLGTDLLRLHAPWSAGAPAGFAPQLPVVGDTVDAVLPPMAEFRARLLAGDFASWEPYVSGGSPLGSVPSLSLLSPLALPYLLLPSWYAPAVGKLLELAVAIGGTWLFCRRLGLSRAAGVLAGVAYASSGFLVTWTNWQHTKVAALVPALFWAVERLLQRRRPGDVALLAVVLAAMLLGGFPAVTGYALYATGAYLLVRVAAERRLRSAVTGAALGAGGVLLGIAVAAVALLPFLDQYAAVAGDYDRAQDPSLHPPSFALVTALVPDAFGTTADGGRYFGAGNPVESIAYVGVAVALLAVVGCAARPVDGVPRGVRGYLAAGLVGVTVLCWFGGRPLGLVQHLPVFSDNLISRIRVLFGLYAALLAGLGYEALRRGVLGRATRPAGVPAGGVPAGGVPAGGVPAGGVPAGRVPAGRVPGGEVQAGGVPGRRVAGRRAGVRRHAVGTAVWVLAGLAVAFVGLRAARYARQRGLLAEFADRLPLPLAVGVAALVLLGLTVARRPAARAAGLALLPVLVVLQALAFVGPFWPRTDRADFYPVTAAHEFLAERIGSDRFDGESQVLYPSTGAYYGLRSATGHTFRAQSWYDLLLAADPIGYQSVGFSGFTGRNARSTVHSPVLDRLSVRWFGFAPGALPLGEERTVGTAAGRRDLGDGDSVEVPVPAAALRGVGLELAAPARPVPDPYARVAAEVRDGDGRVLAAASRRLTARPGGRFVVAVAAEDAAAARGPLRVRFTLHGRDTVLPVAVTAAGVPVLHQVRAAADGLRLAFDDDVVLYERTTSLPRVRWAARAVVVPDGDEQLRRLAAGVPADTVVLGTDPPTAPTPSAPAAGAPTTGGPAPTAPTPSPPVPGPAARVELLEDSGDTTRARVTAPAAGWLVVADALQRGWVATVDGRPAVLRDADHALVAVAVPAGTHEVTLAYRPPGRPAGAAVTGLGLLVLLGLAVSGRARPSRRSTGTAGTLTAPSRPGTGTSRSSGSTSG